MILVDTSVWVDHLRSADALLTGLLERGLVLAHPWVTGELALGHLTQRQEILALLSGMPQAAVATSDEILALVQHHELIGLGIEYVEVQLLAATLLTPDARLWTNDKRLAVAAAQVGCAVDPADLVADEDRVSEDGEDD